ncbi:MAG: GAF domain-containing protein [Boseongicola sp.]|nr:GAF domain-containing protein [Boseongicola sp.]
MQDILETLLASQADDGQPERLFQAVENACADLFGFHFLTILQTLPGTNNVRRMHSSSPDDYPVGALKPMGGTPWGKVVIDAGETWLGNSRDDVLWAFPDAQLILSKGCEACACAPVRWNAQTKGVLSLNAARDSYSVDDLAKMAQIAQTLLPALISPPSNK